MQDRCIMHIDCNSFFASSSLFYRPWLRDKPVAIGGREDLRHGIVVAANYIAKGMGVKTAMALWEARRLCPELVVVPAEHERYSEHSRDIKEYLAQFSPRIRSFGVDEGWYDMTEAVKRHGGPQALAEKILADVPRLFGITVSIGVSWNMVFAKLGSDCKKPNGITYITRTGPGDTRWQDIVYPLPVEDLLYIGHATKLKLNHYAVYTIGDLAKEPVEFLVSLFGKIGYTLHAFASGLDCEPVAPDGYEEPVKSVGNGCTTPRDLTDNRDVLLVTSSLVENAARRLREHGLKPQTLGYAARDAVSLTSYSRQAKLGVPTNRTAPLIKEVYGLFCATHHWQGGALRSFRVRFSDLMDENAPEQISFAENAAKAGALDHLQREVDVLNERFGLTCVRPARSLTDSDLEGMGFQAWNAFAPIGYFG